MANKPTQPVFPLGLAAEEQSTLAGVLNTGTIEHGPDAVLTLPEGNASAGLPSSVRYNADSDEFEGFYENGGWLPLGGGGIRWEVLPHTSTATLTEGRGYLINNTTGASTVVLPSPTRIGDSVTICDAYGKFATYPLTVSPSGNNLYGSTEDMAITTDNVSATFTWSGPEQGWVITSGVGLGQGRVYSREIFTKILASETSSVTLNTPPTIVDVYADGKRLAESKYSLDGNVITFSPSLPANTELQVIEYTPIQLGNVGGSGSSTITWVYNGGSAIGGETEITLDVVVDDVPAIDINGSRQYKNLGFTFDPLTSKITLAQELEPEDEVVVIINGTPNIYNQIDYTLREVARATNVKDTEVVYFSVGAVLSGYKVIYDKVTQRSYFIPELPTGTTAVSLSSSAVLVHSAGSVDLGALAVSREEYVTLPGTFESGATLNVKNELLTHSTGKYRWDGELPKTVSSGSTPVSTGGIAEGAWRPVGDLTLRNDLISNEMLNMSPLYYGATGDGLTDDTGFFTTMEASVSNRVVDLGGRTFYVTSLPSGNKYTNGYFKVGAVTVTANGRATLHSSQAATPINVRRDMRAAKMIGQLNRVSGRGSGNVVQSFCMDDVNGYWYTLSAHQELGSFVNRFQARSYVDRSAIDKSEYMGGMLGHQGLTVEYRGKEGVDRLWTSMGYEPTEPTGYTGVTGNYALSFVYKPISDGVISDYEIWQVYDGDQSNGSTTPHISSCGRYLITRIQQTDAGGDYRRIRIWEMSTVRAARAAGVFNISNMWVNEFKYYPYDIGVANTSDNQSMACDGNYIYIAEGANTLTPAVAYILIFDIAGNHIDTVDVSSVGYQYAVDNNTDGTGLYELEGLAINRGPTGTQSLVLQFACGIAGNRKCPVFELGSALPQSFASDESFRYPYWTLYGNRTGTLDIAGLATRGLKLGCVNSDGDPNGQSVQVGMGGVLMVGALSTIEANNPYRFISSGIGGTQLLGIGDSGKGATLNLFRSDETGNGVRLQLGKSRSTTYMGSAALQPNDSIGFIDFIADDGAANWSSSGGVVAARIHGRVVGAPTAGLVPTELVFSTMDNTSVSTPTNRWRVLDTGHFIPHTSNAYDVGSPTNLTRAIYSANGSIQTSDRTRKTKETEYSPAEINTAIALGRLLRKYKMLAAYQEKGDNARWHFGIIAQDVIQAFTDNGLDWSLYGVVCHAVWDAKDAVYETVDEVVSEDGSVLKPAERVLVSEAVPAGELYAVRYDELCTFIAAGQQQRIDSFEARLAALEAK